MRLAAALPSGAGPVRRHLRHILAWLRGGLKMPGTGSARAQSVSFNFANSLICVVGAREVFLTAARAFFLPTHPARDRAIAYGGSCFGTTAPRAPTPPPPTGGRVGACGCVVQPSLSRLMQSTCGSGRYGALSSPKSRVDISWSASVTDAPTFAFVWREQGGPPEARRTGTKRCLRCGRIGVIWDPLPSAPFV